jgi:hypothetical protein
MTDAWRSRRVDVFCASIGRIEALERMIASVRESTHPARVLVGAGDAATVELCERHADIARCVYSSRANERTGCTSALNLVFRELIEGDALFCTDDIRFDPRAIEIAMETLYTRFTDGDGVVGLRQSNIPQGYDLAFPLMGAAFLQRFRAGGSDGGDAENGGGDLFFPGYYHQYNDAELGETVKTWGNWVFEPNATVEHDHPCATGLAPDETFVRARTMKTADDRVWAARRAAGELWAAERFPEIAAGASRG